MKKLQLLALALVTILIFTACGGTKQSEPTAEAPTVNVPTASMGAVTPVAAEAIYKQNCVSCHGVELAGGVGPNIQKAGAKYDKAQLIARIQSGGGGMPAYKAILKADEIEALAEWLAQKK